MKRQLTYIAPLRAGIVLGLLYGMLSLIVVPFILVASLFTLKAQSSGAAVFGIGFVIALPVIYAVLGFVGGIIAAALYNLVAKWTGGFVLELRDLV